MYSVVVITHTVQTQLRTEKETVDSPAVDDDGPAEEVLEGVDTAPQLQEEMGLVWDAVVGPAHELDVGHFPLCVLLPLLHSGRKKRERQLKWPYLYTDSHADTQ